MSDIAEIGFRANTSDLDKAVLTLNKLKMASKGVATSTNQVSQAVQGSSKAMSQAAVLVARATSAKAKANLDAMRASETASRSEIKQATAALKLAKSQESAANSVMATAKANEALSRATVSATQSQVKQLTVMQRINKATGVSRGMPKSARDSAAAFGGIANDQMPNRFNTANIAAQFQDIGVTAAMGMNPMTVALQQGTQLSAILNSMESPLAGLKQAFTSIINPVSLMAIGFVGITVALIQLVNWSKAAQGILMSLGGILETISTTMGVLAQGILIVGVAFGIAATVVGIYTGALMLMTLATVAGRQAAMAQVTTLGTLIVQYSVLAAQAVFTAARMAAAWVVAGGPIAWITAGIVALVAGLGILATVLDKTLGTGLMTGLKTSFNFVIGGFLGAFKGIGAAAEALWNKILRKDGPTEIGKAFADAFKNSLGADYIGAAGAVVKDGLDSLGGSLKGFASGINTSGDKDKKGGKTEAERYEDVINGANRRIATLKAEEAALGLTREAASALKTEQDLINQAMQKNIDLTPQQRQELAGLAEEMARIEEETLKAKEAMDFAKGAANGFVSDLRSGLKQGENLWDSFASAAVNALDKILDKMIQTNINKMFESNSSSGGGLLGSLLGAAAGIFTGGFGGNDARQAAGFAANPDAFGPFAKGGAFGAGGVQKFAKGGTFTNGVYSRPTPFKFAGGDAFGEMGEAGPEAVMPLHRGSDGSLGVKMSGGGSGDVTYNYEIDARGADVGVEHRIRNVMLQVEKLRKDSPEIAVNSVRDANNRNLGFFR